MRTQNCFTKILEGKERKAVLLDGGFGTELERQGKDYAQVLGMKRRKFALFVRFKASLSMPCLVHAFVQTPEPAC